MKVFILKRILSLVPMLLGVTFLVFVLMSLSPGDFLTPIKMQRDVDPEYIERLQAEFGLDEPWYVRYGLWLKNVFPVKVDTEAESIGQMVRFGSDFGYSWHYKVEVWELLRQRLGATALLSITSLFFAWIIAIPLGVFAAIYKDSIFDRISSIMAYGALSVPEFFLALLALFFAAQTGLFPVGGFTSSEHEFMSPARRLLDIVHHLILPTIVLGIGGIASIMRIMRSNFLDNIRAEYVTTARAKGVPEGSVMFRHVFRNAINPLITAAGFAFSTILSGALLVEIVMNYPGIGQLVYQAFMQQDQFVVLGAVVMGCTMLIVGNLVADLVLAWTDPRIRYEK